MTQLFSTASLQVQAKVTEILTAAGWTKRLYGQAAYGSFYIAKTVGTDIPESIGLWCSWHRQGAIATWPCATAPDVIAQGVLEAAQACKYPLVTYLTNSMGEYTGHGEFDPDEELLKNLPFEEGPGDLLTYLIEIGERRYYLGNLEVAYQAKVWERDDLQTEEVVTAACAKAIEQMRAHSAAGVIVFPLDHEEMPNRCVVSVAIPLSDDSSAGGYHREKVVERLKAAFMGYEDADVLLQRDGVAV